VTQARPRTHEVRPIALGTRALIDNSAALLRMTKREHKLGWGYAQLIGTQVAEKVSGANTYVAQSVVSLDSLGAQRGAAAAYSDLAAAAAAAGDGQKLIEAARRLYDWKEITLSATD